MGHGTVETCQGADANEAPFSRLFRREDPLYDTHAISLLAGPHGPLSATTGSGGSSKPAMPAGFTFLGQFVDHDLTEFRAVENMRALPANPELSVRQVVAPEPNVTATNGRTAVLDLDAVYGLLGSPDEALFDEKGYFILGTETRTIGNFSAARDIRRNTDYGDGRMIADPRNDENKIILQLHTLFMRLHNLVHGAKPGENPVGSPAFMDTCETVKAAYQRILVRDYVPRLVHQNEIVAVVSRLKASTAFYNDMVRRVESAGGCPPGSVPMPVEFAQACFRLGHSQLRAGYRMNDDSSLPLFQTGGGDLRGREPIDSASQIDWKQFFGPSAQAGEPLDAKLPEPVFRLPPPAVDAPPQSLAERNIRRGADFGVASGQTCAVALKSRYPHIGPPLSVDELGISEEVIDVDPSLATQTPLWLYMLREAEVRNPDGPELGEVAGLIVAETILGSLSVAGAQIDSAVGAVPHDNIPNVAPEVDDVSTMAGLLKLLGEV